jgi:pimeloyl-ACP methyl ester carboxylesterase
MRKQTLLIVLSMFVSTNHRAEAQIETTIQIGGSDVVLTVWEGLASPAVTVLLGGHSWGGGMALAYAARDASIRTVFSIAGTDHGTFIRKYLSEPGYAAMIDPMLESTAKPQGPKSVTRNGKNNCRQQLL